MTASPTSGGGDGPFSCLFLDNLQACGTEEVAPLTSMALGPTATFTAVVTVTTTLLTPRTPPTQPHTQQQSWTSGHAPPPIFYNTLVCLLFVCISSCNFNVVHVTAGLSVSYISGRHHILRSRSNFKSEKSFEFLSPDYSGHNSYSIFRKIEN